jgi:hypothetical protein
MPKGLQKIRYFGFMGNRDRTTSLVSVREHIASSSDSLPNRLQTDESAARGSAMEGTVRRFPLPLCGRPLSLHHTIGVSSSGLHWLTSRLAFLRAIHGPEPNRAVFA